jgi:hypothetical protein
LPHRDAHLVRRKCAAVVLEDELGLLVGRVRVAKDFVAGGDQLPVRMYESPVPISNDTIAPTVRRA